MLRRALVALAACACLVAGLTACNPTGPTVDKVLDLPRVPWAGGPAYYQKFPDAVAAGWTDPGFFPIGCFWCHVPGGTGSDAIAALQYQRDLGVNFLTEGNSDEDACAFAQTGMSWVGPPGSIQNLGTCGSTVWPGNSQEDEIDGRYSYDDGNAKLAADTATKRQQTPGKFIYGNFSSIPIQVWHEPAWGGKYVNNYTDLVSVDDYVSSSPNRCGDVNPWPFDTPVIPTAEQCRQAQSYGKITDGLRGRDALDGKPQPATAFTDVRAGADPTPGVYQAPVSTGAEAISSVIHGAGFVIWFPISFSSDCQTDATMSITVPACAKAWQDSAAKANHFIELATPWLNEQAYQWTFGPDVETRLSVHGNLAVILAMTTGGTGARTFTLPPQLASATSVGVVSGDGTEDNVPVTDGRFTYTFSASTDYRAFVVQVPDSVPSEATP